MSDSENKTIDFIREIINEHNKSGRFDGKVQTRFPPEPNGYLHIGHAKAVLLNYGLAEDYNGKFNLRFDDTNPEKEETEYVESIIEDVAWLGVNWEGRLFYASDYFDRMHEWAIKLIKDGKAYVCDQTDEEIREYRGTAKTDESGKRVTLPGKDSPYRNRTVEENLDLFERMGKGEFDDGTRTLRAKIDMAHPNLNMRDPVMYRIQKTEHHRQGNKWCIYPMYDWAHGLEDSIEGITHSCCSLEFENHRPLYDWFLDQLGIHHPQQIEFARLNLTYTVMSKRRLLELVKNGHVNGWDDPRMPTISGMRRRGYPAEALRDFCKRIGIAKTDSMVEIELLESCVRQVLNQKAPRVMGVLNPLKVVITNFPEGEVDVLDAVNNPEDESAGTRKVPFTRELYIEREDFMEEPPKKFFRLAPGREVRLRYAYFVTCTDVVKDDKGEVVEIHCTYDPETRGGDAPDGRKVKGTLHWVSATESLEAEVNLYERLFANENPNKAEEGKSWLDNLNPDSLAVLKGCRIEPSVADKEAGFICQFERQGYFNIDKASTKDRLIFNRTVTLKDSWKKIQEK
ncbi:MAG: glutamine--tRNA ligase/YqeY domain fusion protein [Planctomycetes bacterium]|nr:glutamine--tRNA ligase/YqeY domain fusion protein [Planctomycetota bacterium]